jgi:hypothetical protein
MAMAHPLNDVVVVLPGIMGSELVDADGRVVWGTSMGSLVKGVLTGAKAIKRLQLPDGIGDADAPDGVVATRLLDDIHVIPGIWSVSIGYEAMTAWFRSTFDVVEPADAGPGRPANLVAFPYDWRLSNRANARRLQAVVEPLLERSRAEPGHADARLVFVCHSMGGLVARYYVDVLGGHEVTGKVITLGTPHRGALNALESLVNGVKKGFGPLKIDLGGLARSMPSLHQLLPEYACIETPSGLAKTTEVAVPELDAADVADAMRFHLELRAGMAANAGSYRSHPILARTQPTSTTARLVDGRIVALRTIEGRDEAGDGTVPRLSASPYGVTQADPINRYVMDKHGALCANAAALVELGGVLTAREVVPRDVDFPIGIACDDVLLADEALDVTVDAASELALGARVVDDAGRPVTDVTLTDHGDDTYGASVAPLAPGRYALQVAVRGTDDTVTTPFVVVAIGDD